MRPFSRRPRMLAAVVATAVLGATAATPASAYPPEDAAYLDYAEMVDAIDAIAASRPEIARIFSIGQSFEGRELWAATVSDHVDVDENEPEVLFDGGIHGREHLSTEMAVVLFRTLVDGYGTDARITRIVDTREVTILFNLNPDGSEHDHTADGYRGWRKNRQPTPGSTEVGTDINRNFGYRWGTNPLNASPAAFTYRGPAAWSTPEATAFKRYVDGRVVGGDQQIRVHVTFHQHGRIVLYPFGWTTEAVPADMDPDDHLALVAMAKEMARLSGYAVGQSSSGEIHVGNQVDWMYATHRILSFTVEMGDSFTMPDEAIATETARNLETALYAMEQAGGRVLLPNTALPSAGS
jgi:carboxypeptidase T